MIFGDKFLRSTSIRRNAVVVIGFNRPELLSNLLNSIPQDGRNVYIAIDGARNLEEKIAVNQSILTAEKYQSTVKSNHVQIRSSTTNQGCKYGVFNAVDWAFKSEDALVILEDDIVPTPAFFKFCDYGLSLFSEDQSIWQLNGWTPLDVDIDSEPFFYQTTHAHIWGWATWKERWKKFDLELMNWRQEDLESLPIFKDLKLHRNFGALWNRTLDDCAQGKIDTWDSQWLYSMWKNNSYAISPSLRMCGNVGFDERATHTVDSGGDLFSKLPNHKLTFKIENLMNFNSTLQFDIVHDLKCYKLDEIQNEDKKKNILLTLKYYATKVFRKLRS